MNKNLGLGLLLTISSALFVVGCSNTDTRTSSTLAPADERVAPTESAVGAAQAMQTPAGEVVIRNIRTVRSLDGSEVQISCEADWVEEVDGLRKLVFTGDTGNKGTKQLSVYDSDFQLLWRTGWSVDGADLRTFQESQDERLETLHSPGNPGVQREVITHTVGENVRELVLSYHVDSDQDRAEARRELDGFLRGHSQIHHDTEGLRLAFLLEEPEFAVGIHRAGGGTGTLPGTGVPESEIVEEFCELVRICQSIVCDGSEPSPLCRVCQLGSIICWLFGF